MKPRIFIVEDEAVVALDIKGRLQRMNYDVVGIASSGEDAMPAVGVLKPDVVLMDVSLGGGMDGIEAAARIKEQFRIPVVYITAYNDAELIARISLTEPFAYVLKPFEEAELHAAVEIALLRHRLESALFEQKQLLATTLNNIDDGVIVAGDDGRVRYLNPIAEALTGWNVDDALGRPLDEVYRVHPPYTLTARDGTEHMIEFRSGIMVDVEGKWHGFVHTFTDVTEREASRRILEQREREYRMLMEQAADAIVIAGPTGRIVAVNLRVCELLGYSREELLATTITDLIDPEQLQQQPPHFELLRDGLNHTFERRLICSDGRMIDVEVSARGMSDGRIQGILHDITERKRAEVEFQEAVRSEAVDKLLIKLHAVRHGESAAVNLSRLALFLQNLRSLRIPTPGGGINGPSPMHRFHVAAQEYDEVTAPQLMLISSLMHILSTDPSFRDVVRPVQKDALRLKQAIHALRGALPEILSLLGQTGEEQRLQQIARDTIQSIVTIKAVTQELHTLLQTEFTCDVNAIVRLAMEKFRLNGSRVELHVEEAPLPLSVVMRTAELSDVICTLVKNSLEACEGTDSELPPAIALRVSHADQRVWIEIEDNGPGIPEHLRTQIFENHFSTKGDGRGFGLGYALRCLEGCGGSLRLDHSAPSGSRFVVELARS